MGGRARPAGRGCGAFRRTATPAGQRRRGRGGRAKQRGRRPARPRRRRAATRRPPPPPTSNSRQPKNRGERHRPDAGHPLHRLGLEETARRHRRHRRRRRARKKAATTSPEMPDTWTSGYITAGVPPVAPTNGGAADPGTRRPRDAANDKKKKKKANAGSDGWYSTPSQSPMRSVRARSDASRPPRPPPTRRAWQKKKKSKAGRRGVEVAAPRRGSLRRPHQHPGATNESDRGLPSDDRPVYARGQCGGRLARGRGRASRTKGEREGKHVAPLATGYGHTSGRQPTPPHPANSSHGHAAGTVAVAATASCSAGRPSAAGARRGQRGGRPPRHPRARRPHLPPR